MRKADFTCVHTHVCSFSLAAIQTLSQSTKIYENYMAKILGCARAMLCAVQEQVLAVATIPHSTLEHAQVNP